MDAKFSLIYSGAVRGFFFSFAGNEFYFKFGTMWTSPEPLVGPPPTRECEVFVYKIPPVVSEQELVSMFEKYGELYTLRLVPNSSGVGTNYAFVRFTEKIAVRDAILWWNGYEIRNGLRISVCKSVENKKLVISSIPRYLTSSDIYFEISQRTVGLIDVYAPAARDKYKEIAANSGMAFLTYTTHTYAAIAKQILVSTRDCLWNRRVSVHWHVPGLDSHDYWPPSATEVGTSQVSVGTGLGWNYQSISNSTDFTFEGVSIQGYREIFFSLFDEGN